MTAALAGLGHNGPPDPLEAIPAAYADELAEAENWLDGKPVETAEQMTAVDALLAAVKAAEKEAVEAKEEEYRPHKDACDAVVARWKPTLDDLGRIRKALAAAVSGYKARLAAEREAKRQEAERAARLAREEAQRAAEAAQASDIAAQREAAALAAAAREAQAAAAQAQRETVKGLRTYRTAVIADGKALINHIARADREAMLAFAQEWADRQVRAGATAIPGVSISVERRAV